MRYILMIIGLLTISIHSYGQSPEELFYKANNQYKEGDFSDAINTYENIISQKMASAEVYYNLGNAYYKEKKYPQAILNYERAKRLAPADKDIDMNLKIANLKIVDKIEPIPQLFIIKWLESIQNLMSFSSWLIVIVVFSWLFFGFFAGYILILTKRGKLLSFLIMMFSLVILLISLGLGISRYNYERNTNEAIVFAANEYVMSSPGQDSSELFVLHEGAKVEILDKVEGWKKIRLADGKEGWMPAESLEII